jgi:hypothetical protein
VSPWRWNKKTTVEDCRSLPISVLARAGVFRQGPGHYWTWRWYVGEGEDKKETASMGMTTWGTAGRVTALQFTYTIMRPTGEKESLDYRVEVVATPCNFGGERYWFVCPLVKGEYRCGRRVTKLYLPSGGKYYGCRHCYDLTYRSAQEHDKRVDALAKLPHDLLMQMAGCGDLGDRLLALKAATKWIDKLQR